MLHCTFVILPMHLLSELFCVVNCFLIWVMGQGFVFSNYRSPALTLTLKKLLPPMKYGYSECAYTSKEDIELRMCGIYDWD